MIYGYLLTKIQNSLKDYQEVLNYLYTQLPMYQRVGNAAFRKDLTNTIRLCEFLNLPQHQFKSIHVAGTNGKGSSSHMMASVLQHAGYKTGLYTSPHLKDFSERIKINGETIDQNFVVRFVNKIKPVIDEIQPSFFEITVAMAFDYFAYHQVDIAVIEVGMGGRLDSTNVILPEVSLITNISMDHSQWLGETLPEIAAEKAGIIKDHIPVVISEKQEDIKDVFIKKASEHASALRFASDDIQLAKEGEGFNALTQTGEILKLNPDLNGVYQKNNLAGVIRVLEILRTRSFLIPSEAIVDGIEAVSQTTGLKGRWQVLQTSPRVICDIGHNEAGVSLVVDQLSKESYNNLFIIWGMVEDKEVSKILKLLPNEASYTFCQASIPRAMPADTLLEEAAQCGLQGQVIADVNEALKSVIADASPTDLIFVGGSTFVVAELQGL